MESRGKADERESTAVHSIAAKGTKRESKVKVGVLKEPFLQVMGAGATRKIISVPVGKQQKLK